jgi:hypothetical protein
MAGPSIKILWPLKIRSSASQVTIALAFLINSLDIFNLLGYIVGFGSAYVNY